MTGDWTVKLALLGRLALSAAAHLAINPLRSTTFLSVPKIVELIMIKTRLSREFGSNA